MSPYFCGGLARGNLWKHFISDRKREEHNFSIMLIEFALVFTHSCWTSVFTKDNLVKVPVLEDCEHLLFSGVIIFAIERLAAFQHDFGQ